MYDLFGVHNILDNTVCANIIVKHKSLPIPILLSKISYLTDNIEYHPIPIPHIVACLPHSQNPDVITIQLEHIRTLVYLFHLMISKIHICSYIGKLIYAYVRTSTYIFHLHMWFLCCNQTI